MTEGSEYNTRRRIRERYSNALLDLSIIQQHMNESDREQALDDVYGHVDDGDELRGIEAFITVAAIAYEAANRYELPFEVVSNHALRAVMHHLHGDEVNVSVESDHTVRIEQPDARKAQMTTIKEILAEGGDPRALNSGDQAALFQQLLRREDVNATDLAIEEWDNFVETALKEQRQDLDKE